MSRRRISIEKKERRAKLFGLLVLIVVLFVLSYFIFISSNQPLDKTVQVEQLKSSQMLEKDVAEELENKLEERDILSYIEPFYMQNKDTVGYIKIGDSIVDYPVLYSGDNEYYMNHTFEKKESKEGAIFLDFRCDLQDFDKTRNIILYGHRMKDGSMFKGLTEYLDRDFYEHNKTIHFDSLYQQDNWEVFTVFETDISFYYIDTDYPTDEKWINFLDKCHGLSLYQEDIKFYPTDIVLTLSTCAIKKNKRFVVMARLK